MKSTKPAGFCAAAFLEQFAAGGFESENHFVVVAEALFRIFIHSAEDGAFRIGTDVADDFARWGDTCFHVRPNGFLNGVAVEGDLTREGVVEGGAQGIHV